MAYGRLYSNKGAMTPGACGETVDGMSTTRIDRIIGAMRHERYRFSPVRRAYIPKRNGKKRPLGLPSWSDKLVAEVVRMILEAYYEPQFSDRSHGFRPRRGCHTALREVANTWTGTTWFIEGDIADCFGSLDHEVMIATLADRIHDSRFLRLIKQMLKAGYLEDWKWNATMSGVPQGGPASPVLANIYLDKLDRFVESVLIPEYTRGEARARNPGYRKVEWALANARKRGDRAAARDLRQRLRKLPSKDPSDPSYRRLRYVRYADDHLLGFAGPKVEAEEIKRRLAQFLRDDLSLALSEEKTLVTHARTSAARFLGYEITVPRNENVMTQGRRSVTNAISLRVPSDVVKACCARYTTRGKPARRTHLMNESDHAIVSIYGAEYRGIVQYYQLAGNIRVLQRLNWVMVTSLLKTLAGKHHSTVSKMAKKHAATTTTPHGPRRCFEAVIRQGEDGKSTVARFGGIPLRRQKNATLVDRVPGRSGRSHGNELIARVRKGKCEICGYAGTIEVHHVRSLADLGPAGNPQHPKWKKVMLEKRRKSLVVCRSCHATIHSGNDNRTSTQ
jgi:group II intron reverse transcriptase/maturase